MPLWRIEWSPKVKLDLDDCDVITYRERLGNNVALIACDGGTADRIRSIEGVTLVEPAQDGTYIDQSGETFIVGGEGTTVQPFDP